MYNLYYLQIYYFYFMAYEYLTYLLLIIYFYLLAVNSLNYLKTKQTLNYKFLIFNLNYLVFAIFFELVIDLFLHLMGY